MSSKKKKKKRNESMKENYFAWEVEKVVFKPMKFSWIEIFPTVKTSSDVGFCPTLLQTALSLVPTLLRVPPVEGRSVN